MTGRERRGAFDVGDVLDGRYQLLRELGRGAAGAVFEARHLFTGRFVAIKLVAPQIGTWSVGELRIRLEREGRALASIHHPGVVEVLDGGVTEGSPFIVMEMLNGRTLEGLIAARGTLSAENTIGVGLQLCSALEAVHRAGVVHRDVKPTNIIVIRDDQGIEHVKLVDFGIARMSDPSAEKLTGIGAVIGTPAYMSPEQLLALEDLDGSADVYSVGVTMFECLSGKMPYPGTYAQVLLQASSASPAPSLRTAAPNIPFALCDVVDQAIAKSKANRFQTAGELAAALSALAGASPRTTLLGPPPLPKRAAGEPAATQRRQWRRAPYNTPASILLPSGTLDGRSEDISEGGVLVVSRESCAAGQRVGLRFALPIEGKVVSVEADVRWVRESGGGLRAIGLEFAGLPAQVRSSIAQYVELMSSRATT
jgi:serine/threonine-protein kinase